MRRLLIVFLLWTPLMRVAAFERNELPQFVEVAAESGLAFRHFNGAEGKYRLVETMGSGAALFDYDGDGNLDIFVANGCRLPVNEHSIGAGGKLFRNRGDGTFLDVTSEAGISGGGLFAMGTAVADYDNDGDVDLYLTGYPRSILLRNNGDGTFTDATAPAAVENSGHWATSAGFFDYNLDGFLDLFVGNYVDYDPSKERVCKKGQSQTYCHPRVFDGDSSVLYRNNGDGTFSDRSVPSGIAPFKGKALGVVFADYDLDGDPDIFVANDSVANFLFRNNGDGTFEEVGLTSGVAYDENGKARAGMGVDFGDYDQDGLLDLIVTNFALEGNALFRNNGDGSFSEVTYTTGILQSSYLNVGFGVGFFDHDNDGDLDVFVANGHVSPGVDYVSFAQRNLLFENREGHFEEWSADGYFSVREVSRGAAFGDIDNDGDIDILITNNAAPLHLLRNEVGNRRNWLILKLIGSKSNRDAIGARVKARVKGRLQVAQVQRARSYLTSHDPRVHLGLGNADQVDELEVHWPSGARQTIHNIRANQILIIEEDLP